MPQQSINDKAFDNIAQKYCRYFDVQSPKQFTLEPVSYTHLTLPTIYSV